MNSQILTRSSSQKAKIQTRAMVKSVESRKPNAALLEAKRRAKNLKMLEQEQIVEPVKDVFSKALSSLKMVRSETGIIYDDSMDQHKCFWDEEHQERPERFTEIIKRCQELDLLDKCKRIPSRKATKEEILKLHDEETFNILKATSGVTDQEHLEDTSSNYNAIYIHPSTFDLSLLSAGCTIDLVDNIIKKKVQNGMAIIRPPGHHAMKAEFNGYCFFNNVAIAARHALDVLNLKKILIIDWDAHHGQGTQRFFYDDPRVLYFSLHRYEFGEFWPNLRESDYDWIGEGSGKGFNFNIPLNKKFMQNEDYLSVFQQILLPVAFEFQPELVIVSAGYDAAFGCPEGEMALTPAFYSHMTRSLMHLADGKLAIVLEGGYCVRSLAEGATLTLRALLDFPSPTLVDKWEVPSPEICETILNCIYVHRPYWKCLNVQDTYTLEELNNKNPQPDLHKVVQVYKGKFIPKEKYPTRNTCPVVTEDRKKYVNERLDFLENSTDLECSKNKLCYVYDDKMCEHKNVDEEGHPECPERIKKIKSKFEEFGLTQRMQLLPSRIATTDEVCLAHTRLHLNFVRRLTPKANLKEIGSKFNSVYLHEKTFDCATLAAGSVLNVVDNILTNQFRSGVCVIRPPGHHAEPDQPHGFCIFNNVAIAAQYAIRNGVNKVLIVDWDVHHGNGTQHIFENNPNVLYISIHRYDNATFFPKKTDANYDVVGKGAGEGFNVNIPWNKKGMTDMEYIMVMQQIVLPIAYEFNPELVLVSAGFDAAIGDPLGGCKVTPEAYGLFTHWLSGLANGRVILCLEGGYNVNSIAYSMTMCTKALLGDPIPTPTIKSTQSVAFDSCTETIRNVVSVHSKYWKGLQFGRKLPDFENNDLQRLQAKMDELRLDDGKNVEISSKSGNYFAIYPKSTCPHLESADLSVLPKKIDTNICCGDCESKEENWICLHCFKVYCGRYIKEHMIVHCSQRGHPLVLSFKDLSVWCYPCETYIDNAKLYNMKNLAHMNKFNEPLLWSYGQT